MASNNMWSEVALVSVRKRNGNEDIDFYTISDSVEFKVGVNDVDFIPNLAAGRLDNWQPAEASEVTMKIYPREVSTKQGDTTGTGVFGLFSNTSDSTQPQDITFGSVKNRKKYRVTFLVTDDESISTATADVTTPNEGARLIAKNGYLVEATPNEFTPSSGWNWNVRFKFPPYDKSGNGNIRGQSTDGSQDMTMTTEYTG